MRRLIARCAAPALTLALAACGGEASLPGPVAVSPDGVRHESHSVSPDGQRIAYWSPGTDSTGRWQLWVANADLSSPVKIPVTATFVSPAMWSPDGARLAAVSGEYGLAQVVIVPASGGEVRRVTEGAGIKLPMPWFNRGEGLNYFGTAPGGLVQSFVYSVASGTSRPLVPGETRSLLGVASPDGSHVAYFLIEGAKSTIWVADGDGANPRQLTTEGFEGLVQYQEWSPDGRELLYESRRTGHRDLWVVPIDGGKARQLTRDIRDDFGGAWSSDGKWIAFFSNRGRQTDIWVVPAAGGPERRVTDTPLEEVGPLTWRPGTGTLTFGLRTQQSALWALDLAGGTPRRLTEESLQVVYFRPSPDGTEVLCVIERGGGIQDLAVVPTAGGDLRVLVAGGGTVSVPRWSPDGRQIVFASDRAGSSDLWIADVSGSGSPRQLTSFPGWEYFPQWNDTGTEIYFSADHDSALNDIWRVLASGGAPTRVTTAGNFNGPIEMIPGTGGFFGGTISATAGQIALSRVGADGRTTVVWDRSTALLVNTSSAGDAVVANVEQPDGQMRAMLLKADGSGGRVLLQPGEMAQQWSRDGQWLLYGIPSGGTLDLGLLRVGDGTTRRLTTTRESEVGAELTPDGRTVLFLGSDTVQRIMAVDLSKLLGGR